MTSALQQSQVRPNVLEFTGIISLQNNYKVTFLEVLVPSTQVVAIGVVLLSSIGVRHCEICDSVQLSQNLDGAHPTVKPFKILFSRYLQTNILSSLSHSTSPRYLRYH